jgi:3-methyladenine DNA glycosylase AlkD
MNATAEVNNVLRRFAETGDPRRATGEKAYLKSALMFYGVGMKGIRAGARHVLDAHPDLTRPDLLSLVDALWSTRHHEVWSVGIELLDKRSDTLQAGDLRFVETMLRKTNTWAHVDWLAVNVVGALVTRFASCERAMDRWARDDNLWIRRSAMLALLRPLRAGEGDFDRFARYASAMIEEREFFIRKAIGWILREVGKKRPQLTSEFLQEHIEVVAGLTLREGAKYLPARTRERLMRQYRNRRSK